MLSIDDIISLIPDNIKIIAIMHITYTSNDLESPYALPKNL